MTQIAKLALADGTVFTGTHFGVHGTQAGEVVFNTAMCGYQEIITDPSYEGQIVTMTYPLIGNYGVNREDVESRRAFLSGFVVRELSRIASNFRSELSLDEYLREQNVVGITGIDTRALTRKLRTDGSINGVLSSEILDDVELIARARAAESMNSCAPKPGWTVITRTISQRAATASMDSTGVSGFKVTPAVTPMSCRDLIKSAGSLTTSM